MKLLLGILVIALIFISCDKTNDNNVNVLSSDDLIASQNMQTQQLSIGSSLNNLVAATNTADRLYWDNLYHQHDSAFWAHHDHYHHETYPHDDHHHQWVPYDPTINHHHHYHHHYPNHLNDSLVIVQNNHHHNNSDHHFPGHDWHQHQVLDSLHHIHNLYHP